MLLVFLSLLLTNALALWPIPRSFNSGFSFVKLDPSFDIKLDPVHRAPKDLLDAICLSKHRLLNDNHERLVVGRGAGDRTSLPNAPSLLTLVLSLDAFSELRSIMEEATKPLGTRIEGYTLSIPSTGGTARITAKSSLGLFRALTTFEQLFYFDGLRTIYTHQAPIQIADSPAYVGNFYLPNFKKLTLHSALPRIHARHVSQLASSYIWEYIICS
jgi:hexosaminidase